MTTATDQPNIFESEQAMTTATNENAVSVVNSNPMTLIQTAIEHKADPEQLGKLMDLQERWEANHARKAYNAAMVAVQGELPRVCSDKRNTQTNSDYPTETRVRQTIQKKCLEHGFTFTVDEAAPPQDDMLCVRLTIRHADGHEATMIRYGKVDMYGPKGNPNSTHVQGCQKTTTYLGRRMLLQAFGVVVDGDDDDGNGGTATVTEEQSVVLQDMIDQLDDEASRRFFAWAGVDDVANLPANRYDTAFRGLKKSLGGK